MDFDNFRWKTVFSGLYFNYKYKCIQKSYLVYQICHTFVLNNDIYKLLIMFITTLISP